MSLKKSAAQKANDENILCETCRNASWAAITIGAEGKHSPRRCLTCFTSYYNAKEPDAVISF